MRRPNTSGLALAYQQSNPPGALYAEPEEKIITPAQIARCAAIEAQLHQAILTMHNAAAELNRIAQGGRVNLSETRTLVISLRRDCQRAHDALERSVGETQSEEIEG